MLKRLYLSLQQLNQASTVWRMASSARVWLGLSFLFAWFFPIEAMSLLWVLTHALLGWIEIALKSLLEELLGLSHRAAQVTVAWTGLGVLIVLLVIGARRLWSFLQRLSVSLQSAALVFAAVLRLSYGAFYGRTATCVAAGFALTVIGLL